MLYLRRRILLLPPFCILHEVYSRNVSPLRSLFYRQCKGVLVLCIKKNVSYHYLGCTGLPASFSARSPTNGSLTYLPINAPLIPTNQEIAATTLSNTNVSTRNAKNGLPKDHRCAT